MAFLQIIVATIFWGASFFFIKLALNEISSTSFIFWRFLVGTLSITPLLLFSPVSINYKVIKQGIHLGILQLGIILFQTLGLESVSASLSAFLTGFYIVFVLIIRFIVQRRLPSLVDIITSVSCILGLGLLTHSFSETDACGILYTLVGALFMAFYIYLLDLYVANSSMALTFIQMVTLAICSSLLLFLPGNTLQIPIKAQTWLSILFCGICCSTICFWLQNRAQRTLKAFKVSVILMLEPVLGTVFACLILDEKLYPGSYMGIIMILGSIAVINLRLKQN
jgi:drug/metabolite transporter (DMT)-like permease